MKVQRFLNNFLANGDFCHFLNEAQFQNVDPLKYKRRSKTAITQECCKQYWTSPGGNTPQDTNYTAICLPSRKLSKLDEPDMQDTAGEAGTSS